MADMDLDQLNVHLVQDSKTKEGPRNTILLLVKEESKWWPRLLKATGKAPPYVKVDWDKWVDEDEENSSGRKCWSINEWSPFGHEESLLVGSLDIVAASSNQLPGLWLARGCEEAGYSAPSVP